jgi:hypothetical protein
VKKKHARLVLKSSVAPKRNSPFAVRDIKWEQLGRSSKVIRRREVTPFARQIEPILRGVFTSANSKGDQTRPTSDPLPSGTCDFIFPASKPCPPQNQPGMFYYLSKYITKALDESLATNET